MNILITGGAGYIGSVVAEQCVARGYRTVVIDNLVKGHKELIPAGADFAEGDIMDKRFVKRTLEHYDIDAVIHMAAYSLVGESGEDPLKYYSNNLLAGIALLEAMVLSDVKKIVFSSTAAVYGEPKKQPINEDDSTIPTNPYGETKLAFENALKWFDKAYGLKHVSLRYFNAAGASQNCGECHDPETHLIPIILQVAAGKRDAVDIFGTDYSTRDGTCVRDYIHVIDLAAAHLQALNILDHKSSVFNLGCGGDGYSVKEVINAAKAVTGKNIPFRISQRRVGDPATLIASSNKIKNELGWDPKFQDLNLIIESAWKWMQKNEMLNER